MCSFKTQTDIVKKRRVKDRRTNLSVRAESCPLGHSGTVVSALSCGENNVQGMDQDFRLSVSNRKALASVMFLHNGGANGKVAQGQPSQAGPLISV